jgi:hypothetical protein
MATKRKVGRAVLLEDGKVEAFDAAGTRMRRVTTRAAVLSAADENTAFVIKGGSEATLYERTVQRGEWTTKAHAATRGGAR